MIWGYPPLVYVHAQCAFSRLRIWNWMLFSNLRYFFLGFFVIHRSYVLYVSALPVFLVCVHIRWLGSARFNDGDWVWKISEMRIGNQSNDTKRIPNIEYWILNTKHWTKTVKPGYGLCSPLSLSFWLRSVHGTYDFIFELGLMVDLMSFSKGSNYLICFVCFFVIVSNSYSLRFRLPHLRSRILRVQFPFYSDAIFGTHECLLTNIEQKKN